MRQSRLAAWGRIGRSSRCAGSVLSFGIWKEDLPTCDPEGGDQVLPFVRTDPVGKLRAGGGVDVRVLRRIDDDQIILVEQARISFDQNLSPTVLPLGEPCRAVDQNVAFDPLGHGDRQSHAKPAFAVPVATPRLW